jgi:hypothetical protein
VNPDRLGAADQAPKVLRILDPIQGQDEWGLSAAHRSRQDLFWGNLWAASNHQRDPLMPIEAGELADQCPFNFNNGDAQGGRVQHHLLQRGATLRNDEELDRLTASAERLFYRVSPRNQLLIEADEGERLRRNGALRRPVAWAIGARSPTTRWWTNARSWGRTRTRARARSWRATLLIHSSPPHS